MVELYAVNIQNQISKEAFDNFMMLVSEKKREKINRFRLIEDAKRSLYGEILVRYLACNQFGINNDDIKMQFNEYGKPYIEDYLDFHFNLSHSGQWIVCAISKESIGIDIEQIKPIDIAIAERFFDPLEYKAIMDTSNDMRLVAFYKFWTLKESYIKLISKGLSMPLNSFAIEKIVDSYMINYKTDIQFYNHLYKDDYIISVSYKEFSIDPEIKEICVSSMKVNLR